MTFALRDYQEQAVADVRGAFKAGSGSVLLVLATGAGKCLAKDTPVLMYDGTAKLVQDILPGELLMGPDSKPRRVLSLARGREMMYRVTPTKGDPYTVNESHILSLRITGMGGRRVLAGDGNAYCAGDICNITVQDYLRSSPTFRHVAKGWRAPADFPAGGKLPVPAYILGAWLGDGMTGKLAFTTSDNEIAAEIRRYAVKAGMRCKVEQNSDWSVNIHLCGSEGKYGRAGSPFGNALRELGIFRDKAVPHVYKTASRRNRLELLAGLIDTDGHYDGKGYALTLKSERLLDDAIFVARSLGLAAYKSAVQKKCHNNGVVGTYFSCNISGDIDAIPCRLPRKQAKPRGQVKNVLNVGIKVEPVGDGDYYGFEIDGPDRLFLLGDFTVTHNTVIFSHIAKNAAEMGNNVLILAHRDQLIKQASRKLRDYGVRHGIIMAGFTPDMTARVQVASVQTLVRRLGKFKWQPKLIVIDETHLAAAKSYRQILDHFHGARILGVTGSPCRLDGKPLGRQAGGIFDHMVTGISIRQLIDRGFLVQPVVYAPAEQLDLSSVHMSKGDFDVTELAAVVDRPQITGSAVAHYQRICPGEPAVAWCVNLAHAEHVAAEFNAQGIQTMMLSGEDDSDTRDKALRALETGRVQVITFVGILIEGVDCPAISAIILLRPTMSLSSYLQVIGRGLRPHTFPDGRKKTRCVVLDHAGLTFKHGLADEERDWSLDDEEAKKPGKKKNPAERNDVIQCVGPNGCYGVWRIDDSPLACPHCGNPVPVKTGRELQHAEGELTEITPEMAEAMRNAKRREVKGAKTLEELQRIAAERGYSPGWARATFEAKQRTKQKYQRHAGPPEPTLEEMKSMTLEQLTRVAREQGWPHQWPSEFYHSQRNLGE